MSPWRLTWAIALGIAAGSVVGRIWSELVIGWLYAWARWKGLLY